MLRTLPQTRDFSRIQRLAMIALFTALTIIAARLEIHREPVPFTMQPFAVLLAGMVLGRRDGILSQLAYVSLIALGFPFDARGLGTAALFGPTGGYLIGFIAAAGVIGWLVEHGARRVWQRWLAGVVGIGVIYLFGIVILKSVTGLDWSAAWAAGAAPFLLLDLVKAVIAAGIAEGARLVLRALLPPG
jgi:biotin transport system substrate-specific component